MASCVGVCVCVRLAKGPAWGSPGTPGIPLLPTGFALSENWCAEIPESGGENFGRVQSDHGEGARDTELSDHAKRYSNRNQRYRSYTQKTAK